MLKPSGNFFKKMFSKENMDKSSKKKKGKPFTKSEGPLSKKINGKDDK